VGATVTVSSASTLKSVMGLQSFERGVGNMVDNVFTRSSRNSTIRPVELGRRLLREMDDHRSVDVKGRRIVPNAFTFHLSPRDHAGFEEIERALIHELTEAAREYARDEGYNFVGPVSVSIAVDNTLKPGRFGIASHLREAPTHPGHVAPPQPPASDFSIVEAPPVEPLAPVVVAPAAPPPPAPPMSTYQPTPIPPAPAQPPATRLGAAVGRLQLPSGERVTVGHTVVSLGRLPECTITLNDPNVSRRHAEIRPGSQLTIVDLGSTNGTKVNGLRIEGERVLVDGDIVSVGSSHLRFEAASTSA
jgi:Protein of unknown function (DUF3662)/FHA domain